MKITYNHSVVTLALEGHHHPDDTCLLIFPIVIIASPVKSPESDDTVKSFSCKAHKYEKMRHTYWYAGLAALPALGQGAP